MELGEKIIDAGAWIKRLEEQRAEAPEHFKDYFTMMINEIEIEVERQVEESVTGDGKAE